METMAMEIRFYCANCLQYMHGYTEMSPGSGSRQPPKCENVRCRSGFSNLFAFHVPGDFPQSLGNSVTDAINDQMDNHGPGYRKGIWRRFMDAIGRLVLLVLALRAAAGSPISVLAAPVRAMASVFRCAGCERNPNGKIKRNRATVRLFMQQVGWTLPADGVRVDHIIALACGPGSGAYDGVGNMQLQWVTDAAAKDKWERLPNACDPATQASFLMSKGQLMPNAHSRMQPAQHAIDGARRMREEYAAGRRK